MPDTHPTNPKPPRRSFRRLWIFLLVLLLLGFIVVNGAAYLAARSMTHYVPNAERPHIHVPMTAWDKTRFFLGEFALPRPVNHLTPGDPRLEFATLPLPA